MKKMFMLFILLLIPFRVFAATLGDVNGDGKINVNDYVMVRKYILRALTLTNEQSKNADVNGDGVINVIDYIAIRKDILGIEKIVQPTGIDIKDNYIEGYFLNTMNSPNFNGTTYSVNDAFVFKTSSNKYILLDAGIESDKIKKEIYDRLKSLQGQNNVVIDYMIISHMHDDHFGNAINILKDSKIEVKNLILKRESLVLSKYNEIVNAAKSNKKTNIMETSSINEGSVYKIDDHVKMYLFNVKDVFLNENCENKRYSYFNYSTNKTDDSEYARNANNQYIYFNGLDYLKKGSSVNFYTSDNNDVSVNKDNRMDSKFYMKSTKQGLPCNPNANSIAVVFQVMTNNGNKYIYLPSDLENNGYNPFGEYDSNYNTIIHGLVSTYFNEYTNVNGIKQINLNDNKISINSTVKMVKKPSEYLTAKTIKAKFNDIVGNISIYQESHHGLNNAQEALELLGINNEKTYSIVPIGSDPKTSSSFLVLRSQYYLNKTNIRAVGGKYTKDGVSKQKKGIKCVIRNDGTTSCVYY